ncbi:DUF3168 domain-containing protein [Salipiger sp. PrR003]|uniref:DUF3168 domain-containing protein n=1 Tax=Salipiger sp. PrR003 TaxID=2706776 RepID=UPI0013DD5A09|nr:DUF3168 domain-containing protein [Salipiger sp. PrR003]NDV52164.1 DUF3168 domain-containing protein [Salipiger sp. PrR003]NDV52190.1 DUF3168 domain-containing protein [Salipiger sp. PrR003]
MSADLPVQIALRARLVASPAVTGLVPASSILDRNSTPAPRPSIILGEVQVIDEGDSIARTRERIVHTLHVWKTEPSREGIKQIMAAMRAAIRSARLDLGTDYHCVDWRVSSVRALSDPDGESSHGVLTVEVLAEEVSA